MPARDSHLRPGDNYFSSSRLAIHPDNGKIVWHFQTTPHDGWDYDGVNKVVSFNYREYGDFIRDFPFVDKITWATGLDEKTSETVWRHNNFAPLWGGAVPLWGGEVAKRVKHLNQGGTVWTFKSPQKYAKN